MLVRLITHVSDGLADEYGEKKKGRAASGQSKVVAYMRSGDPRNAVPGEGRA